MRGENHLRDERISELKDEIRWRRLVAVLMMAPNYSILKPRQCRKHWHFCDSARLESGGGRTNARPHRSHLLTRGMRLAMSGGSKYSFWMRTMQHAVAGLYRPRLLIIPPFGDSLCKPWLCTMA